MVPFFSMKNAAGSSSTSVPIFFGSAPGRFQKAAVSVSHSSWTTSISSRSRPSKVTLRLGVVTAGFWPTIHTTFIEPSRARSKML